jgi:hypothetical protein
MWVNMNTMKMGVKTATDSLIPRRFIQIRRRMAAVTNQILYGRYWWERMLNRASAPEAIEIVIVRM